jgi:hypothetical protein
MKMSVGTNDTECKPEQYQYGQWIRGAASNCGLKAIYNHSLEDPFSKPSNKSIPLPWPFADWCWKPTGCKSKPFSIEGFCKKLNGRRILMVGDSLQHHFFQSLFMQLDTPGQPIDQFDVISELNNSESSGICLQQGGGHLVYLRNDQLSVRKKSPWNCTRLKPFVHDRDFSAIADQFDIFVMNKGAHHVGIVQFQEDLIFTADWLKTYIQTQTRNISIFYRNTPQGHAGASTEVKPLTEPLTKEPEWARYSTNPAKYNHHWELFPIYDRLAMQILHDRLGINITFLQISYMTFLRPDGHRCKAYGAPCDDLHYFLPSVVDSWVQVFYNLLT